MVETKLMVSSFAWNGLIVTSWAALGGGLAREEKGIVGALCEAGGGGEGPRGGAVQ